MGAHPFKAGNSTGLILYQGRSFFFFFFLIFLRNIFCFIKKVICRPRFREDISVPEEEKSTGSKHWSPGPDTIIDLELPM